MLSPAVRSHAVRDAGQNRAGRYARARGVTEKDARENALAEARVGTRRLQELIAVTSWNYGNNWFDTPNSDSKNREFRTRLPDQTDPMRTHKRGMVKRPYSVGLRNNDLETTRVQI